MIYKFEESLEKGLKSYRFVAYDGQTKAGDILFVPTAGNTFTIRHTIVDVSYKGQNIGRELVKNVANWAKEHDKKIISECPFARKEFESTPEYRGMLAK